jgi:hypothetical protein
MRNLRLPRALVALGFGGILFWTAAVLIAVLPVSDTATFLVYWLTTTAGYGLAGFACWRWISRNWVSEADGSSTRSPARWMAAAALVTAVGVAALTSQLYQDRPPAGLDNADLHYALRFAGYVAGTLGFVVAAAGFWVASNARPGEPGGGPGEPSALEGASLRD